MLIDNQFILNIMIHVCILFIFLYIFFFLFISKKGEDVLNENIKSLSNDSVNEILKEIDEKFGKNIDWKNLREKCLYIKNNPNNEINKSINDNNNYYKNIGMYIIISLIIIIFIFYFSVRNNVNIFEVLRENLLTFILIGLIEYIFFVNIASKYIPSYPATIETIILERSKENINYI
jgi:energy-coupling factor transporter transmembrane protein EcfT